MMEARPKKRRGIGIRPLKGRAFDMRPASNFDPRPRFSGRSSFWAGFVFLLLLLIPLGSFFLFRQGSMVLGANRSSALEGAAQLQQGAQALQEGRMEEAKAAFASAEARFLSLSGDLRFLAERLQDLPAGGGLFGSVGLLSEASVEISRLGVELSAWAQRYLTQPPSLASFFSEGGAAEIATLNQALADFSPLVQRLATLESDLASLDPEILPAGLRPLLQSGLDELAQASDLAQKGESLLKGALVLLGDRVPHRTLVLFQNSAERRATGGFIGSYAIVDVEEGRIAKIEAKDVYESDGQLTELLPAPPGIDRLSEHWSMRDANTSPDFPTSARQVAWFLERSRGPSVDSVVAITPALAEAILGLVGPVNLENPSLTLDAERFTSLISYYVEAKLQDGPTPKQMLFDLIPILQKKLEALPDAQPLVDLALPLVQSGDIQAYSFDPDAQALWQKLGADGVMPTPKPKGDFLALISTSIGANKSDAYIRTEIEHRTRVSAAGELTDRVKVEKRHQWGAKESDYWRRWMQSYGSGQLTKDKLRFILGEGGNLDYVRLYVPRGSRLSAAEGVAMEEVSVSEELGYTVFGFVFGPVSPGEAKSFSLEYSLPFSLPEGGNYPFLAHPQAAAKQVFLKKGMELDPAWRLGTSEPSLTASSPAGLQAEWPLDQERSLEAELEKKRSP